MAYIGKQPVVGNFVKLDAITTSATATYNLLNGGVAYFPQTANNCIVSLNGIIQEPTSSGNVGGYTISGSTIVFTSALTTLDVIDFIIVLGDVLNIGTPSDNTVSLAKLTATGTKNATTFLRGDNTFATAGSGGLKSIQVFSTAGSFTYTKPSGVNLIKVYITGGGGGGGLGGGSQTAGGGGGAGGTAIKVIDVTSVSTVAVTIGAGGASQNAGSTSSFSTYCSATGGEQGLNAGAIAGDTEGGVGSGGDINLYGEAGGGGSDNSNPQTGGSGGSSFWGGGGYGIYNATGKVGYHGGGGGGGQNSSGNIGGAGGAGICVVEEYS